MREHALRLDAVAASAQRLDEQDEREDPDGDEHEQVDEQKP